MDRYLGLSKLLSIFLFFDARVVRGFLHHVFLDTFYVGQLARTQLCATRDERKGKQKPAKDMYTHRVESKPHHTRDYQKKEQCMLKGDSHIDTAARGHEEGPSEAHQRLSSRRTFLSGSAKLLGGGALALGLGAAPAFAKDNDHDDEDDKKQGARETTAASQTSTSSTTPSF